VNKPSYGTLGLSSPALCLQPGKMACSWLAEAVECSHLAKEFKTETIQVYYVTMI